MISLKKYLDMEIREPEADKPEPAEVLAAILNAYRLALLAMGKSGAQACPSVGRDLQQNLETLERRLAGNLTPPLVKETEQQVTDQLQQWGGHAAGYFKTKTAEIKELLIVLARTAESVGERDHHYAGHFQDFTTRLRAISNLDDITQVRVSLVQQASELKAYVDKMEQESQKLVTHLQTEVSGYETRLKEAEELAMRDPLTGLANRRNVEERIESRIASGRAFSVAILDLNRLKQVNDKYGHLAGDSLLQQFAQELRSCSRSTDLVGRWGGDEFIVVMDCDANGAHIQLERMQKWVFGTYTIRPGKGTGEVKVNVDAALGKAQWQPGETSKSVIERADADMYKQKGLARKQE